MDASSTWPGASSALGAFVSTLAGMGATRPAASARAFATRASMYTWVFSSPPMGAKAPAVSP